MTTRAQQLGANAETKALIHLEHAGLTLIERNYRRDTPEKGEIDLIMDDQGTTVFVEVRLRTGNEYGTSLESITPSKQSRVIRTATYYLLDHKAYNSAYRFDAVGFDKTDQLIWIKDAFQVNY